MGFTVCSQVMQGNHTLVTGGYDGLIVVWNTDSGAVSAHLSFSSHQRSGLQERCIEQVNLSGSHKVCCTLAGNLCPKVHHTESHTSLKTDPMCCSQEIYGSSSAYVSCLQPTGRSLASFKHLTQVDQCLVRALQSDHDPSCFHSRSLLLTCTSGFFDLTQH